MTDQASADPAQLHIDGFPVVDRRIHLSGDFLVTDDVYDSLTLGSRLRVVLEVDVTSRRDKWVRDEKWGDDEAHRSLGVSVADTRSVKVVTDEVS